MAFVPYNNALAALATIKKEDQIVFIFIDIEMPRTSAMELAKSLKGKTKFLIFTTSHSSQTLTAFELKASQYLLNPLRSANCHYHRIYPQRQNLYSA